MVFALARWIHFHRQPDDLTQALNIAMPSRTYRLADSRDHRVRAGQRQSQRRRLSDLVTRNQA